MNLLEMTYGRWVDLFRQRYDRGEFYAGPVYRAFYGSGNPDPERLPEFANAPGLGEQLREDLDLYRPQIVARKSDDGVTKLVFELKDAHTIETVIIPMANHATVCVSCQVGCRMGCRFCQTAQMGWKRNLSTAEIVAQVHTVKAAMGLDVRNVVFMGMGEPLDNFDAVVQAIRVLEDQRGLDIAKRRMTLSTVGLAPEIEALAALNWPQLKLALSLNAADNGLRTDLMPINAKYPLERLKQALAAYPLARGNALFIEYVQISGVNDSTGDARRLAGYLDGLPVKLNLIPYNPRRSSPFQAPTDEEVARFHQALIDQKIFVRLRRSKGTEIRAACGQLGEKFQR